MILAYSYMRLSWYFDNVFKGGSRHKYSCMGSDSLPPNKVFRILLNTTSQYDLATRADQRLILIDRQTIINILETTLW